MSEKHDNRVRLWPNKADNIKAPLFTGKGMVNGKAVQCSAWSRVTEHGPVWDISFEEPRQKQGRPSRDPMDQSRPETPQDFNQELDDDLPF